MRTNAASTTSTGERGAGRTAGALVAALVGMGGLAACSDGSAGPVADGVSAEDLQELEERIGGLEERIDAIEEQGGALEDGGLEGEEVPAEPLGAEGDTDALFDDGESLVGQEVTVSARVSEVVTTTDVGSSFRIAGGSGAPVAVVMASQPMEIAADDVVRVSGMVVQVQRDTFEQDFGIAADQLFEDAEGWLSEEQGSVAIAADRIEVLQEQGQDD